MRWLDQTLAITISNPSYNIKLLTDTGKAGCILDTELPYVGMLELIVKQTMRILLPSDRLDLDARKGESLVVVGGAY